MKQQLSTKIKTRYAQVCEEIEKTAISVGRQPHSIRLVVVTKTHPVQTILAALEAGVLDLGENYAEEAVEKINAIGPINNLNWHMIGHIQSRKADLVSRNFDFVHSVDSYKLASRLNHFSIENDHKLPILLECNVSGEVSKFGYPSYEKRQLVLLEDEVRKLIELHHLEIRGLMTMPPLTNNAEESRPFFQRLRDLRDYLAEHFPQQNWTELSMGTSADFPIAVQEGATIVRVGTSILGNR